MVYNAKPPSSAERLLEMARAPNIPVVGATETEPGDPSYQAWMRGN